MAVKKNIGPNSLLNKLGKDSCRQKAINSWEYWQWELNGADRFDASQLENPQRPDWNPTKILKISQ